MNESIPFPGMSEEETRELLRRFECSRCLECCRKPGYVYLKKGEEEGMAAYLQMDAYDFVEKYCEVMERRRLVLKKNSDESCVFLTAEGCRVHPAKPEQCRDFPVRWRTPASFSYCEGMKRLPAG